MSWTWRRSTDGTLRGPMPGARWTAERQSLYRSDLSLARIADELQLVLLALP